MTKKLSRSFYTRADTLAIARELLGKLLVVPDKNGRRVAGMIVETEAYLGEIDRAAHSYRGRRTPRNESTYLIGGHAYVFFVYGMYDQLNVVCCAAGSPQVVLIRGVEPVEAIDIMRVRRGEMKDKNLTSGPGKLCIAFGVTRDLNGADLIGDQIWLEKFRKFGIDEISTGPRIGIDYAGDDALHPWRFWVTGNSFVSRVPKMGSKRA